LFLGRGVVFVVREETTHADPVAAVGDQASRRAGAALDIGALALPELRAARDAAWTRSSH
jgi:hypothetical protein